MTKKKSILTFMLAICLMIPAAFMLTACGHRHKALAEWSSDATYHWHTCEECDELLDKAEHTYGDWTVRTPASCETDGLEYRVCVCGKEETRAILATGHTSSTEYTYNETHHWHTCEECDELLDKAEHSWGEWTEKTPASNGVDRVEKRICSVCAYEETKTIENSRLDFYMIIEDVETIRGKGCVAKGTIQRGTVSVGDEIEISGCEKKLVVADMMRNKVKSKTATYGDYVEILVRSTTELPVGQFLFKEGTMESNTIFKASVTNKNTTPYPAGMQTLDLYVHGIKVGTATVVFDEQLDSENTATVRLVFTTGLPLYEGLDISLKDGDVETLTGTISK